MKVLSKDLRQGLVKLVPESSDDLWLIYTILKPGDIIRAKTLREVHFGSRGSGRSSRIAMRLTIRVEKVEFQPFTARLRVRGVVVEGPEEYGVKGKYHTISLEPGRDVEIIKPDGWPSALLRRLESAIPGQKAVIVAVDYDEYAIAVVEGQGVRFHDSGSLNLPGKDDPSWERSMEQAVSTISRRAAEVATRESAILLAVVGPGSVKERVATKLRERVGDKVKVLVDSTSMGGEAGVYEELRRGIVRKALEEAASIKAEKIVEEFEKLLAKEPYRVAYTVDLVWEAVEAGAAEKVLVLDNLLHDPDPALRDKVYSILIKAEQTGAEVVFVSEASPVFHKLRGLGGILAVLRYPLYSQA
ncbi:MAG: mRNA surveillance protein pelota [Thermoproteota archaeon]